jgi:hypothetical protein
MKRRKRKAKEGSKKNKKTSWYSNHQFMISRPIVTTAVCRVDCSRWLRLQNPDQKWTVVDTVEDVMMMMMVALAVNQKMND